MAFPAVFQSKSFLNQDQRNIIVNSFTYSNFNYCPLIWHLFLPFIFNDYTSDYGILINKSNKCAVEVRWLPFLTTEVFSSKNEFCLHSISLSDKNPKKYNDDLKVSIRNFVTTGEKSV